MAVKRLLWEDFTGGVNLLDAVGQVRPKYVPDALNVTSRGGALVRRFGIDHEGWIDPTANYPSYVFWTPLYESYLFVLEYSGEVARYTLPGMMGRTVVKTFTTNERPQACTFGKNMYWVHPTDGVFSVSGPSASTWTNRSTTVKGRCIAVWQNKLWVGGNDAIVWWSAAGDGTTWNTTTDFNYLREVDERPIIALGAGNGMDVVGRAGLMAFKSDSTYRIYDSETGAYTTVDTSRGADGPEAVTSGETGTYFANKHGIYRYDGERVTTISIPIAPAWDQGLYGSMYGPIAWSSEGRHYFTTNDAPGATIWEFLPETSGWWPHQIKNAAGNPADVISATSVGYGGATYSIDRGYLLLESESVTTYNVARMWASPDGQSYSHVMGDEYDNSPTGTGPSTVAFQAYFRLPWIGDGLDKIRLQRVNVQGWCSENGAVSVNLYKDWDPINVWQTRSTITWPRTASLGGNARQDVATIQQLGVARAMAIELYQTGLTAQPTRDPIRESTVYVPGTGISAVEAFVTPIGK